MKRESLDKSDKNLYTAEIILRGEKTRETPKEI